MFHKLLAVIGYTFVTMIVVIPFGHFLVGMPWLNSVLAPLPATILLVVNHVFDLKPWEKIMALTGRRPRKLK